MYGCHERTETVDERKSFELRGRETMGEIVSGKHLKYNVMTLNSAKLLGVHEKKVYGKNENIRLAEGRRRNGGV